jgi:hypothetical protein
MKPRFDDGSVEVVDPTVQAQPKEGGPIAELIDENHRLGGIVFLTKPMKKRSCRICPRATEYFDVDCSVQPRPFAVDRDSGLVDRDLHRLRQRRVGNALGQSIHSLNDRLKRPIYTEQRRIAAVSLSEQPVAWNWTANALTGVAVRSRCQRST